MNILYELGADYQIYDFTWKRLHKMSMTFLADGPFTFRACNIQVQSDKNQDHELKYSHLYLNVSERTDMYDFSPDIRVTRVHVFKCHGQLIGLELCQTRKPNQTILYGQNFCHCRYCGTTTKQEYNGIFLSGLRCVILGNDIIDVIPMFQDHIPEPEPDIDEMTISTMLHVLSEDDKRPTGPSFWRSWLQPWWSTGAVHSHRETQQTQTMTSKEEVPEEKGSLTVGVGIGLCIAIIIIAWQLNKSEEGGNKDNDHNTSCRDLILYKKE